MLTLPGITLMTDYIITVENLVKKFGELAAVDNISFNVAPGEIFGFLGPNGAGKTTTINILCTLSKPTSGHATIDGFDVVRQQKPGASFHRAGLSGP